MTACACAICTRTMTRNSGSSSSNSNITKMNSANIVPNNATSLIIDREDKTTTTVKTSSIDTGNSNSNNVMSNVSCSCRIGNSSSPFCNNNCYCYSSSNNQRSGSANSSSYLGIGATAATGENDDGQISPTTTMIPPAIENDDNNETTIQRCQAFNKMVKHDQNSLTTETTFSTSSPHPRNQLLKNYLHSIADIFTWNRWSRKCNNSNKNHNDNHWRTKQSSRTRRKQFKLPSIQLFTFHIAFCILVPIFSNLPLETSATGAPVGLSGSTEKCEREGEVFPLPGLLHDPCYTCLCRNGEVQCEKQTCPNLQGCFLIVSGLKDGCCDVCKGCTIGNQTYPHGKEILLDDCTVQTCLAGIVTKSSLQCHVPCSHPIPPTRAKGGGASSCCPSCSSCYVNGKVYQHGEEAILNGDPCTRCSCNKGSLSCIKKACPVLACPPSSTYLAKGDCCPKCNGTRTRYIPRTVCILGDKVYPSKTTFRLDTCTNCTCSGTTAICDRISCPPLLDCEPIHQVMSPGSCCPTCSSTSNDDDADDLVTSQCQWRDRTFNNGEKWDVNSCQSCICDWGKVRCTEQLCPKDVSCPWGYQLRNKPGVCCPECIGEEGVCTVFGDPHYRSFDGRVFNFQGACKYLLTSDCKGKTFSVRVRNDARASSTFSWTRTVTLKTKEGRLTLGQKMRIKFNGKRVSLPFTHGSLKITMDGYSAAVETGVGLKMLWDGDSYLEVAVAHRLHGRLCGLCGNFNGNRTDDFVTRRGGPVNIPSEFGSSWRVGGKKACSRPEEVKGPEPLCRKNWLVREKAEKLCNALKSHIFSACAKVVPADRFFKACKVDMCECPSDRKCHCDALMAYSRACKLAGVEVNWRDATRCTQKKFWKA